MENGERSHLLKSQEHGPTGRFSPKTLRLLSYFGFFIACVEKAVNGSIFSFAVYLNDLKSTFNYSQTEIEVIVSASNFGEGLAVFPGLFFDRFGSRLTCAVGLVVTVGSLLMLWSSTQMVWFYTNKFYLIAIYYITTGMGSMFCYIASQNTSIFNFKFASRGKLIGIQDSIYGGSLIIFTQVYYNVFTKYDSNGEKLYADFPAFLMTLVVLFCIADFLCLLFSTSYYPGGYDNYIQETKDPSAHVSNGVHASESTALLESKGTSADTSRVLIDQAIQAQSVPFTSVLKSYTYHIYLWTFVLIGSVDFVALNNLTTSSKALGYSRYDDILISAFAATVFFASVITGVLADVWRSKVIYFQLTAAIVGCIATVVYATGSEIFPLFVLGTMLICIPSGIMWTSVPTDVSARFGIANFGRNWGFIRAMQTIFNFFFQYIFGYLYEMAIDVKGSIDCYGLKCVQTGYLFLFGIDFLSLFVFIGLFVPTIKRIFK